MKDVYTFSVAKTRIATVNCESNEGCEELLLILG